MLCCDVNCHVGYSFMSSNSLSMLWKYDWVTVFSKFQNKCNSFFIKYAVLPPSFLTGRGYLLPFSIQLVLPMEKGQHWGLSFLILSWSVSGISNLLNTIWVWKRFVAGSICTWLSICSSLGLIDNAQIWRWFMDCLQNTEQWCQITVLILIFTSHNSEERKSSKRERELFSVILARVQNMHFCINSTFFFPQQEILWIFISCLGERKMQSYWKDENID